MDKSHIEEEIKKIEKETGMVFAGWEVVGGEFMDRLPAGRDRATSEMRFTEFKNNAGMKMRVPIFRRVR